MQQTYTSLPAKKFNVFHFILLTWPLYLNDIPIILWAKTHRIEICSMTFFTNLIYPLFILYLFNKKGIVDLRTIFQVKKWNKIQFVGIWILASIFGFFVINKFVYPFISAHISPVLYGYSFPSQRFLYWFFTISCSIIAGLTEETIFRGVLFDKLSSFSSIGKIVISSLLFSLAHWCTGPGFLLTSFIYGLFFAILYLRTRNIFLLILVHTTIDLMIF